MLSSSCISLHRYWSTNLDHCYRYPFTGFVGESSSVNPWGRLPPCCLQWRYRMCNILCKPRNGPENSGGVPLTYVWAPWYLLCSLVILGDDITITHTYALSRDFPYRYVGRGTSNYPVQWFEWNLFLGVPGWWQDEIMLTSWGWYLISIPFRIWLPSTAIISQTVTSVTVRK